MKQYFLKFLTTFIFLYFLQPVSAQIRTSDWTLNQGAQSKNLANTFEAIPAKALRLTISPTLFQDKMKSAKQDIQIPNPEGRFETFEIKASKVVADEVAHLYTIQTFVGYKKSDPSVQIACDISDIGFHAAVYDGAKTFFIEPLSQDQDIVRHHAAFYKRDSESSGVKCLVDESVRRAVKTSGVEKTAAPNVKRNYRLAIVATGEYGQAFGGNPYNTTNVLNAIAAGVNLINPIYLRDLGIDFTLVSNANMVFSNPNTDPFNINSDNDIFNESRTISNSALGVNNYDLGHVVIWQNLGGLASFGVVCNNNSKAQAYSGTQGSLSTLWVDYVAHEIGHQFRADHNFISNECGTSAPGLRYEPGEGSSIMAYASVCGPPVQYANSSDPYFHSASIDDIMSYVVQTSCASTSGGNSSDPIVNAQADIVIPKETPFVLVGSASDPNDPQSALKYTWEQFDGSSGAENGPPNCNSTDDPLFRFRPPVSSGVKSFPSYSSVKAGNNNGVTWDKLPCTSRIMNFALVVRDNNPTYGRVAKDMMKVTVAPSGPFQLLVPNGGQQFNGNGPANIAWSVNGTNGHCPNIDILLSTDGGTSYNLIAASVANDGAHTLTIPNIGTTAARILVRCAVSGGYNQQSTFYDVSNNNFIINATVVNTCPDHLITADFSSPTPNGDYEAKITLTSDKILANGGSAKFSAGDCVELITGFEVPSSTMFEAVLENCP